MTRRAVLGCAAAVAVSASAREDAATPPTLLTVAHPDGRPTVYRMMTPPRRGHWPVVLFSHGANSSSASYDRLWTAWTARGFAVIGPDHIDTGPRALQPPPPAGLWATRVADASLPLHRRSAFDVVAGTHGGTLDWTTVAAAGHSFGAVVAQALAGARILDPVDRSPTMAHDPAIRACLTFSPPGPRPDFVPADAWSTVRIPSLLQTGDADILPGFVDDWHARLTGFSGPVDRWTFIGHGVDHYFGGLICRLNVGHYAQSRALDEAALVSSAFLAAYLQRDPTALMLLTTRAAVDDVGVALFSGSAADQAGIVDHDISHWHELIA